MDKEEAKKDLENLVKKGKVDIEKSKEAKMSAEEKAKLAKEKEKTEKERKDAEAKAKADAELITKDDKDLDDAGRKRKAELLKAQQEAEDKKLDPKVLKIKQETQKRIDTISNELKQHKDKTSKDAVAKQKELDDLRKKNKELEEKLAAGPSNEAEEAEADANNAEQERIAKYLERDKDKPREKRLEISDEDLDAWFAEEPAKAQAWITRRELRRTGERLQYAQAKSQEKLTKDFLTKQTETANKVAEKHPEIIVDKRYDELKAEGKEHEEIMKIIREENPKYRVCADLLKENPKKYLNAENGPELIIADMEKRLSSKGSEDAKDKQIADLSKAVEDLTAQVQQITTADVGINSTKIKTRPTPEQITEGERQLVETMKSLNTPQANIDSAVEKYRAKLKT